MTLEVPRNFRGALTEAMRRYHELPAPAPVEIAPRCAVCNDIGWVLPDVDPSDPLFNKAVPCPAKGCEEGAKQKALRLKAAYARAGIPKHYTELTFETFNALSPELQEGKILAAACAFMWSWDAAYTFSPRAAARMAGYDDEMTAGLPDRMDTWLTISGNFGTGKTGIAAAASNKLIELGRPALFYRAAELFTAIQDEYKRDVQGGGLLQKVQQADCLILDELTWHAGQPSDDKRRIIEEIMRYRRPQRLPTLITTNADQRNLEMQWGSAAVSMITEGHWVTAEGKPLRTKSAEIKGF